MSDDLSAIHAQTSAILEKLFDQKGQPEELDASFTHEFFNLVAEQVKFDGEAEEEEALGGPHVIAKLSHRNKGLIEVNTPSTHEKFLVSDVKAVRRLRGTTKRFGTGSPKGTYHMSNVKGIPTITINAGLSVVIFLGLPSPATVQSESGMGEWVKI